MNFTKAIIQDGREYLIFQEEGKYFPVAVGFVVANIRDDYKDLQQIIRTAKYLANYENRNVSEGQANAALFAGVELVKANPVALNAAEEAAASRVNSVITEAYATIVNALN